MDGRWHDRAAGHAAPRAGAAAPARAPLVGRAAELARLIAALARAARGSGGALFLVGEAGVGKTRLAREALALARARGFLALEGRAYPLEGGLAYAPLLEAFRPLLRGLDPAERARLLGGLPDLGRLFVDPRLPPPERLGDPALEKTRLFDAVARLLERLAGQRPVLLFLDDLHWADPASVELVHYLARGLADQPALVLAAYRPEEADRARGLEALVRSLRRGGLAEDVPVGRLGPDAVAALAGHVLGADPPPELLALLAARAGGTPLFVETLLAELLESGRLGRAGDAWTLAPDAAAALPAAARELVLERLQRLEPEPRRLLELIAVHGAAAPHAVLRAASGLDEAPLLVALQRLRAAGLVVEAPAGLDVAYDLGHPLVREVAYAELPGAARRRAHAACAAALEATRVDPGQAPAALPVQVLERLAYHYRGAGPEAEPGRALALLLAAGERARELHANDAAARHFGAALALLREGRVPGPARPPLPWLLERLGEAWGRLGELAAAVAVWTEALDAHEAAGDAAAAARLRRRLALAEWDRGRFEAAQAHLAAGLAALAAAEPSQELVDLLQTRLVVCGRLGDADGVTRAAAALVALSERLGSPRALAAARGAEGAALAVRGEHDAARAAALRALAAAEAAGEPLLAVRALDGASLASYLLGEHRPTREYALRSLERARNLGAPALQSYPLLRLVLAGLQAGAWDEAARRSAEMLTVARRVGQPRGLAGALGVHALVLALRGDLAGAERSLAGARSALGAEAAADRNVFTVVDMVEAVLALEQDDGERARVAAAAAARPAGTGAAPPVVRALLAEATAAAGDGRAALGLAQQLAREPGPAPAYRAALAASAEGAARRALGQRAAAMDAFRRAGDGFDGLEMPFEAARARLDGAALAPAADAAAAVAAAQDSLAVFERLGARRYADRARRLLHELGARPPAGRRPRPRGSRLSSRELEVARLVAEGLRTAEIAERLVLSPRTVTTHLDRIYARLGITSRAALARHVVEAGLLAADPGVT